MDTMQKKAFRKAFMGGFSKKDVNRYIAEAASKSNSEIEELKKLLEIHKNENDSLKQALSEAQPKANALASVEAELSALTGRYAELSSRLAEKEESEKLLSEKCAELEARIALLAKAEAEYTARKAELAEIEISARNRAAEHIAETERELSSKREAFESEMAVRERHFAEVRAKSLQSANDSVNQLSRLVSSLHAEVDSMDSRLTRITDSARGGVATLLNAVNDAETRISDISDVLSSFDNK